MHTDFKDTFGGEKEVRHFYVPDDISLSYQAKYSNKPMDNVVFMKIFKSLKQLLHETFYYKLQRLASSK